MKVCSKCMRVLDDSRFNWHPTTRSGLQSWCKECKAEAARVRRRREKEKDTTNE